MALAVLSMCLSGMETEHFSVPKLIHEKELLRSSSVCSVSSTNSGGSSKTAESGISSMSTVSTESLTQMMDYISNLEGLQQDEENESQVKSEVVQEELPAEPQIKQPEIQEAVLPAPQIKQPEIQELPAIGPNRPKSEISFLERNILDLGSNISSWQFYKPTVLKNVPSDFFQNRSLYSRVYGAPALKFRSKKCPNENCDFYEYVFYDN